MTQSCSEGDLLDRRAFAIALARRAGAEAARFQRTASAADMGVSAKGAQDFVTAADKSTENLIRTALADAFPADGFLGEESGGEVGSGPVWVVDPIDGTNNYLRGLKSWGVSIALVADGDVKIGVIYDAISREVVHASVGGGAYAGDTPLRVSELTDPERALAILGYSGRTLLADHLAIVARLIAKGADFRRFGTAALGLLRVAEGKADLYHEAHLYCWDVLAGMLIAREAGAIVMAPDIETLVNKGGPVLAIAPSLSNTLAPVFS